MANDKDKKNTAASAVKKPAVKKTAVKKPAALSVDQVNEMINKAVTAALADERKKNPVVGKDKVTAALEKEKKELHQAHQDSITEHYAKVAKSNEDLDDSKKKTVPHFIWDATSVRDAINQMGAAGIKSKHK